MPGEIYEDADFRQKEDKTVIHGETGATGLAPRRIFAVRRHGGVSYALDWAGDCYRIEISGETISFAFICGVLAQPEEFTVGKEGIRIRENLGRTFLYSLDGRIETVKFNETVGIEVVKKGLTFCAVAVVVAACIWVIYRP